MEHQDYRGYAGDGRRGRDQARRRGDGAAGGFTTRIASIDTFDGPLEEAAPADVGGDPSRGRHRHLRGDMICRPHNQPDVGQDVDAMICWMADTPRCAPAEV
jgi:bifunctional enzyme CysN/CysC